MLRSITEKEKKPKGRACLIIILLIFGFIVSVYFFGEGLINEFIHP